MKVFISTCTSLFIAMFVSLIAACASTSPSEGVALDANSVTPLLIGQPIPSVKLITPTGDMVDLKELTQNKASLIIVYRGGWCPYCNQHFKDLRKIIPDLSQRGLQVLAISPDSPENLQVTLKEHKMVYDLLSDSSMEAAKALGLAYQVSGALNKKLKQHGIDIEKASGESHQLLPVPAIYVVNREGLVTFSFVSPDYKVRASNTVISAAVEEVLK